MKAKMCEKIVTLWCGLYLLRTVWQKSSWRTPLGFSWVKENMLIYLQTDYETHWILRILPNFRDLRLRVQWTTNYEHKHVNCAYNYITVNNTRTHAHTHTHTHSHTHTHTHTCLERRGGTIRASLNFLRISEVFVIHRVARSHDYRNHRICAISRSAANGKYRTEKKRDGTQTSVTPESRPFQGNSTRNFCWCTPVHVLNHTSEEITIFRAKIIWSVEHALLHYSTWSNPMFYDRGRPRF